MLINQHSQARRLQPMAFAILRTSKLKTMGNIGGSGSHNFRERTTHNADSKRTHLNKTIGAQNTEQLKKAVQDRLDTVKTVRKNAVLAVEYLMTASPEFFKNNSDETIENYFDRAEKWLRKKHGAENVVAVTRQYDETSQHICAYVVPIDEKGKLNARHFLGGRQKLKEMQTDFAENVGAKFGLKRGLQGTGAKHTAIHDYYAALNESPKKITLKASHIEPRILEKTMFSTKKETSEDVAKRLTSSLQKHTATYHSHAVKSQLEAKNNEKRSAKYDELRKRATELRNVDLEPILLKLDCTYIEKEKIWRTAAGRINIEDRKFYNIDQNLGGGGAIDIVKHLLDADFNQSLVWLAKNFGNDVAHSANYEKAQIETEAAIQSNIKVDALEAHKSDEKSWSYVKKYLTDVVKISADLSENLKAKGVIYADKFKNFVFKSGSSLAIQSTIEATEKPILRGVKQPFLIEAENAESSELAVVSSVSAALKLKNFGYRNTIATTINDSDFDAIAKISNDIEIKSAYMIDNTQESADRLHKNLITACKNNGRELPGKLKPWEGNNKQQTAARAIVESTSPSPNPKF